MPFAQAGDVKLYYETFGHGVPFLFISGTGWPGEPWKLYQAPAFADCYQVIIYDHRGVGKSDAPAGYYSTRMFAHDAANLLDAIGIKEPAHVIGHSMGGRVCQWLAIDHPQKVRSMIQAASGSGSMGNADYPRWLTLHSVVSLIEKGYKAHMWSHFQSEFFFPPDFVKARPDVLESLFKSFWDHRPQLDPYLRHVIARNQHETGDLLAKIITSTLVLVGSEDNAASDTGNHYATSEYLRDHIAGAEFAVVASCGHGFFWQKPEEVNTIIRDWLDRH
ncbi:MAG: alpha/beta fold hydrolase [Deltaproteobacteria bacterium]|nr:alpha/beta fold hydrolase [Deltaproteobacteria bacterium]